MVIVGASKFGERFVNSVVIRLRLHLPSIVLGVLAAYAFSRFRVPLKDDLLVLHPHDPDDAALRRAIPIF
jgi:multiple sugar transport system permease protein